MTPERFPPSAPSAAIPFATSPESLEDEVRRIASALDQCSEGVDALRARLGNVFRALGSARATIQRADALAKATLLRMHRDGAQPDAPAAFMGVLDRFLSTGLVVADGGVADPVQCALTDALGALAEGQPARARALLADLRIDSSLTAVAAALRLRARLDEATGPDALRAVADDLVALARTLPDGSSVEAFTRLSLGETLVRLGRSDAAVVTLLPLTGTARAGAAQAWVGAARLAAGDTERARQAWETVAHAGGRLGADARDALAALATGHAPRTPSLFGSGA